MNNPINSAWKALIIVLLLIIIFGSLEYLNYKSTGIFAAASIVVTVSSIAVVYLLYTFFKNKIK